MLDQEHATERYVIFASDARGAKVELYLDAWDIAYKRVTGIWEGEGETAWIINRRDWHHVKGEWVTQGETAALHLDRVDTNGHRPTVLEHFGFAAAPEWLGWFWPVDEATALAADAWTRDGDQYYVAARVRPE